MFSVWDSHLSPIKELGVRHPTPTFLFHFFNIFIFRTNGTQKQSSLPSFCSSPCTNGGASVPFFVFLKVQVGKHYLARLSSNNGGNSNSFFFFFFCVVVSKVGGHGSKNPRHCHALHNVAMGELWFPFFIVGVGGLMSFIPYHHLIWFSYNKLPLLFSFVWLFLEQVDA
jgi:hypothetical protein